MRKPLVIACLALSVLAGACSPGPLDPAVALNVEVASRGSLALRNASARPVYYLVFERDFAARALWAPCTNADQCPRVDPHAAVRVEYGTISGYEQGSRQAIVYWWHLVERDGGWVVDQVRSVVVDL